MAEGLERFTARAKHVLTLAQDEARRMNQHDVDTEHLLLGLLRESEGIAVAVLASMGVNHARVRQAVMQAIRDGSDSPDVEPQISPEPLPPELQVNRAVFMGDRDTPALPPGHGVPLGDVQRVVAVNQTQSSDGIAATILSIELYEHGLIIHGCLRGAGASEIARRGPGLFRPHLQAIVGDDAESRLLSLQTFAHADSVWFTARLIRLTAIGDNATKLRIETHDRLGEDRNERSWEFDLEW